MSFLLRAADCLGPEGMRLLEDGSIASAITDPPYSEHVHKNGRRGQKQHNGLIVGPRAERDLAFDHLDTDLRYGVARELARLVRRWVLVFSDVESAHLWRADLEAAGLKYVRTGFWVKEGATPQLTGDRPAAHVEAITICHQPGRTQWNGGGRGNVWTFPIARSDESGDRIHTTQKPSGLMERLVLDFTDRGETVLDPFAGSATTGVAALRYGRDFVGWEMDRAMQKLAFARLEATREQTFLLPPDTSPKKQVELFPKEKKKCPPPSRP